MGSAQSTLNLSSDQQVKLYRQLAAEHDQLQNTGKSKSEIYDAMVTKFHELSNAYSVGAAAAPSKFNCPKVRFGRTELQMPILTCGGMRMQQTWNPPEGITLDQINKEIQVNFEQIVDRCMQVGINHFETARGYGTSELQYGPILKKYKRSDYILQTKVAPKENPEEFRAMLLRSFAALQIDMDDPESYIDLFSFHGINKPEHLVQIQRAGGCMEVIREYQQKGKIRFVGFSTHGMTPLIVDAIETDLFDYVNLHYQFVGSYTASGTGSTGGNLAAIQAAHRHDMGVFIISPSDKGGALYEPSKTFERACQPLTPIAFNNLWLWSSDTPIHTLVIGAARPADIDEHLASAVLYEKRKELTAPIAQKLYSMIDAQFGDEYRSNWWHNLPDAYSNPEGIPFPHLIWLHMIVKSWGLYKFAQMRYQTLEGNLKDWKDDHSLEENLKFFSWVPGVPFREERLPQIREVLRSHPHDEEILQKVQEVHQWLHNGGCLKRGESPVNISDHSGWMSAYNLQPDVPFPERK